jgi:hypothetical protein
LTVDDLTNSFVNTDATDLDANDAGQSKTADDIDLKSVDPLTVEDVVI